MILAVLDDLMFSSKIKTAANQLGVDLRFSRSADGALDTMRKNPTTLVIFDLNNERIGPLAIVAAMKQDAALASIPTVGYRVARPDRRHPRGPRSRRRRSAGAVGVHAAARRDPEPEGLTARTCMDSGRCPARAQADCAVCPPHAARADRRGCPISRRDGLAEARVAAALALLQIARRVQRRDRPARSGPARAPAQLVTASAGNHGRALAAAAETFGLPLVVFTPADAPKTKLAAIRRHGAELRADRPRLRRRGAAGESVRGGDRRRVHFALQRSGRHRRRGDGGARDLRGCGRTRTRSSCRSAAEA